MERRYSVTLTNGIDEATIEVADNESTLDAAWRAGLDLPASCLQGWYVTCAARLLSGEVDQEDALRYYPADQQAGFISIMHHTTMDWTGRPMPRARLNLSIAEEKP